MKSLWILVLLIALGSRCFAQLEFSLTTDKSVYNYGDPVDVTITAANLGDEMAVLEFSSCFQADYMIDGYDWAKRLMWCQAFTYRFIPPHGSTTWGRDYFFFPFDSSATRLTPGTHALVGLVSGYWRSDTLCFTVLGTTDVGDEPQLPKVFALGNNYPNPFNPSTTIDYSVPAEGDVSLTVHDLLGREVAALVRGVKAPGNYRAIWEAGNAPAGIYYYRMAAGTHIEAKKMILVK